MDTMRQQGAALTRAAGQVRTAQADVRRLSDRLTLEMWGLRSHWVGRGGAAFQSLVSRWAEQEQRIVAALERLASCLEVTERDTVATDQVQADASVTLLNRLG